MIESKLKSSVILRMVIIGGLTILLLIPTIFIDESLISERMSRRDAATSDVSRSWGGIQTLTGPILTVPFKEFDKNEKGVVSYSIRYAHFLPSNLYIKGNLNPEIRYRGIYDVALYNSQFVISGEFRTPDFRTLHINPDNAVWTDAFLSFGISDLKGIRDKIDIEWNHTTYPSEPGVLSNDIVNAGITFKPVLDTKVSSIFFSFPLNINGSFEIRFVPVGELTNVVLQSPWGNPSFIGNFLPTSREITPNSFSAEWKVFNLNRNYPQAWIGSQYNVLESSFGTSLYIPVDEYQKTSRSVKYALLFIALTFISFFLSEVIAKTVFHPIQYALVGSALVIFYVLLLSLAEHIGFNFAYLVASLSIISIITLYSMWISSRKQISFVICFVLFVLYVFLFITLQLQDYALLFGSIGLFIVLFIIMFLTRKIDWYSIDKSQSNGS